MRIRRILCATDLTGTSLPALREGVELARELGAFLMVLHVVKPEEPHEEPHSDMASALLSHLHDAIPPGDCVAIRPVIRHGAPCDEILAEAEEHGADLLILGTCGRLGFEHFRLGSTAERVVRRAQCPVITVRAPRRRLPAAA
jgi:nucleotide-binding universal stress UspA family protein